MSSRIFLSERWIYGSLIILFILVPAFFIFISHKGPLIEKAKEENVTLTKGYKPDHTINLKGNKGNITLRRRALSNQEYLDLRDPLKAKKINDETYLGILSHGDSVQLLEKIGWSYKIITRNNRYSNLVEGYIAFVVDGMPTIRPNGK